MRKGGGWTLCHQDIMLSYQPQKYACMFFMCFVCFVLLTCNPEFTESIHDHLFISIDVPDLKYYYTLTYHIMFTCKTLVMFHLVHPHVSYPMSLCPFIGFICIYSMLLLLFKWITTG